MAPTLTREQKIAEGKAFAASQPTKTLVQSLRDIGPKIAAARATAEVTRANDDYLTCQTLNMSRSWIVEALTSRYPEVDIALDIAFEEADENDTDVDFDNVLINAIPASAR